MVGGPLTASWCAVRVGGRLLTCTVGLDIFRSYGVVQAGLSVHVHDDGTCTKLSGATNAYGQASSELPSRSYHLRAIRMGLSSGAGRPTIPPCRGARALR